MPNKNLRQARPIPSQGDGVHVGQVYGDPEGKCWTVVKLQPLTLTESLPEHKGWPVTRRPTPQTFATWKKVTER